MKGNILGLLAVGLLAGPMVTSATTLWSTYTGSPYQTGYLSNGYNAHANAEAFVVDSAVQLTGFSWSGVYLSSVPAADNFVIDIFSNVGSEPSATPLHSVNAGASNRVDSGTQLFGIYPVYDYSFNLLTPIGLSAGTYYFSVNNLATNLWYWAVITLTAGEIFVRDDLGPWWSATSSMAFSIQGNIVPEPGTLALLGLGLGALGLARRRKAN